MPWFFFRKRRMDPNKFNDDILATQGGRSIAWLADAPMFIDGEQVTSLYNAVAKPEHETEKITLSLKDSKKFELKGKTNTELEVGLAEWLKTVFPFLDAKAKVGLEAEAGGAMEKEKGNEIELRPIDSPQRQLVQLALHYLINLPHRTRMPERVTETDWLEASFASALPRGLVFIDFLPGTRFVPMAAEVEGGDVRLIYPELSKSFAKSEKKVPTYPEPAEYENDQGKMEEMRDEYWKFFQDNFSTTLSTEAVEKAVSEAKKAIRWIDYRVPLSGGLPCLHLSLCANGHYDTGIFAYRLVKRGFRHGLRVVGTMKSGPAMNVLAIFER